MEVSDREPLSEILKDPLTMTPYEGPFNDEEVDEWLQRQIDRGDLGLRTVVLDGNMIGMVGITLQEYKGKEIHELGYIFHSNYWSQGYALEAAQMMLQYGRETLGLNEIYALIRNNNIPSMRLAIKLGMNVKGIEEKTFKNVTMPHLVFSIKK